MGGVTILRDKHRFTCNGLQVQDVTLSEITAFLCEERSPQVITLIGGGGKTSLLHLWARCLKEKGLSVVTSTTTKMCMESRPGFSWAQADNLAAAKNWLKIAPQSNEIFTLVGKYLPDAGKVAGIPADWIDQLCLDYPATVFLVEGDGSAGRSLKGHLPYEPVIPASTSLLVPVIGLDVLGKSLNADNVHRPEVLCEITVAKPGAPIDSATVLAALLHEKGYLRQAPRTASVLPLFNKLETFHLWKEGLQLSNQLLSFRHPQIKSVLAGSVHQNCFKRLS